MTSLRSRCPAVAAATFLTLFTVSACADPMPTGSSATGAEPAFEIVTSTSVWADLARAVAASTPETPIDISAVVESGATDPHHVEPAAIDIAKAQKADIVLVGGGGYDAWLYTALKDPEASLHALPVEKGDHGGDGPHEHEHGAQAREGNEHIWYQLSALSHVAGQVADEINRSVPGAHASAVPVQIEIADFRNRLSHIPPFRFAQTEPVADYLLASTAARDLTPSGYRQTTLSHGEPAAAELAAFLDALSSREIDVLIHNPQTETELTRSLVSAAREENIPVIEIGELPEQGTDFFTYLDDIITELERVDL